MINGNMKILNQKDFIITKSNISKGAQGSVDLAVCKHGPVSRDNLSFSKFIVKWIKIARITNQPKEKKYIMF